MCILRVNETKVTPRKAFLDNAYELESEKESKKEERTIFRDWLLILDLSANPWASNATFTSFSGLF